MKLLLVTFTAIAVFTADGREFPNELVEQGATSVEVQLYPDGNQGHDQAHSTDGPKQDQQLEKKKKQHGKESQSTIEAKFDHLEMELQSIIAYMNSSNSKLHAELQSLKDNMNNRCPEGFFHLSVSNQCFKLFTDIGRSWTAAKSKCQSEDLVLAKTYYPLELRSYIVMRYGKYAWLGARGTGSNVKWDRDATILSSINPMWISGQPSGKTSSSYCLVILSTEGSLKQYPTTPYYSSSCSTSSYYALCEYLME